MCVQLNHLFICLRSLSSYLYIYRLDQFCRNSIRGKFAKIELDELLYSEMFKSGFMNTLSL